MKGVPDIALAVLAVVAVGARVALIFVPFPYVPDIYFYDTQAVGALAAGMDPYGHQYAVPAGLQTPGAGSTFAYLPGVVLFLLPFGLASDVRIGLVAADVLVAFALLSLRGRWGTTAAAAYLLMPFSVLFSTWYPNNTLVGIAFVALSVTAELRGRRKASAVLLGVALASSQFVWLLYPFILLRGLRGGRYRETALGLGVAGALVAPFLAWDPGAFVHDAVLFEFGRPVQNLLTPEVFGFNVNPTLSGFASSLLGVGVPLALKAAIVLVVLGVLLRKSGTMEGSLLKGSLFLLAATFVLPDDFSWWYLELPFVLVAAWLALCRQGGGPKAANA